MKTYKHSDLRYIGHYDTLVALIRIDKRNAGQPTADQGGLQSLFSNCRGKQADRNSAVTRCRQLSRMLWHDYMQPCDYSSVHWDLFSGLVTADKLSMSVLVLRLTPVPEAQYVHTYVQLCVVCMYVSWWSAHGKTFILRIFAAECDQSRIPGVRCSFATGLFLLVSDTRCDHIV